MCVSVCVWCVCPKDGVWCVVCGVCVCVWCGVCVGSVWVWCVCVLKMVCVWVVCGCGACVS